MKRGLVLVEGQTEERFVNECLGPHLLAKGLALVPTIVKTKRAVGGAHFKGGVTGYGQVRRDLGLLLHDTSHNQAEVVAQRILTTLQPADEGYRCFVATGVASRAPGAPGRGQHRGGSTYRSRLESDSVLGPSRETERVPCRNSRVDVSEVARFFCSHSEICETVAGRSPFSRPNPVRRVVARRLKIACGRLHFVNTQDLVGRQMSAPEWRLPCSLPRRIAT